MKHQPLFWQHQSNKQSKMLVILQHLGLKESSRLLMLAAQSKRSSILLKKRCLITTNLLVDIQWQALISQVSLQRKTFLFENAFYILTPAKETNRQAVDRLKDLLKGTHAHFIEMTPEEHDAVTSVISHFPHIVAASLVHQAHHFEEQFPLVKRFAAGGFRDITRIASSNPAMWRDILLHNKNKILDRFHEWKKEIDRIESFVQQEDAEGLFSYFQEAKEYRDGLPLRKKGAIPAFYDLYVDVPDHPGVISEITGYLASENISITNIRIIETREDINGILRISFQTDDDRKRAEICIKNRANYDTFYAD